VLAALRHTQFDLLLLDLTMPGTKGADLIERIRALDAGLPILVYSMHNELHTVKRVLQSGIAGFVTKGSEQETLISAIRKVAAGGRFIDPIISEQVLYEKPAQVDAAPHERLSERELQVMKRLAQGRLPIEIAEELFISNRTVSTYKSRLMEKMNFHNISGLVRYAAEHGLID
jgi:DNA-binding NarL/FixJ family response regulator